MAPVETASKLRNDEARVRDFAREQRDRYAREASALLERSNGADAAKLERLLESSERWAGRVADFDSRGRLRAETARVAREPLTYDQRDAPGRSFFADLARCHEDPAAAGRLERHAREMHVELRSRAPRERRSRGDIVDYTFERRVNPNTAQGQGGSFAPPLWLIDQFASVPRPRRVIADLCTAFPLPGGVSSVNVPQITTGTQAGVSAPLANLDSSQVDITDAPLNSPVVTVSGESLVSLQLLEQSPQGASLDQVVFADLIESYDAQLETRVTNDTGATGHFLGVANVAGAGSIAYTGTTPVAFHPALGQAFANVANQRKIRPECFLMRGGRWAWMGTGQDSTGRPLCPPGPYDGDDIEAPGPVPVGQAIGIPVYSSEAIPTNLGTGTNQDQAFALRPSELLLWESEPRLSVFQDHSGSGSLEVRIVMVSYCAFIASRYPTGICTIGSTGMVVPTGF